MTSPRPSEYAMLPAKTQGVFDMPAKVVLFGGRVYVRITYQGQDRKLGAWRGARVTGENAPFLEGIINQQILAGLFRWEDWFPRDRKQYLVSELAPKWQTYKPRRPATIAGNRRVVDKLLLPELGHKDVRTLGRLDFLWIRDRLGDTPQAKTVTTIIQAFMNWCYEYQLIPRQIFLPKIHLKKKKTPFMHREDQELILEGIPEPWYGPCLMSVEMGMRTGEILALRWTDIDHDCGGLTVNRTYSGQEIAELPKEGREKWLPVPERLQKYLQAHKSGLGWVFVTKGGSRIRPWQMTQSWKHSARDCGFPGSRCHHNRNSLATQMREAGASIEEIGALLGHRHVKTTEGYLKWPKTALRKILKLKEVRG